MDKLRRHPPLAFSCPWSVSTALLLVLSLSLVTPSVSPDTHWKLSDPALTAALQGQTCTEACKASCPGCVHPTIPLCVETVWPATKTAVEAIITEINNGAPAAASGGRSVPCDVYNEWSGYHRNPFYYSTTSPSKAYCMWGLNLGSQKSSETNACDRNVARNRQRFCPCQCPTGFTWTWSTTLDPNNFECVDPTSGT